MTGAMGLADHSMATRGEAPDAPRFGATLALWVALTVLIEGGLWVSGFRTTALATAVDRGAARVEALRVGEVGDELIRKALRTQYETLPFWTVLAFLGDFLAEPMMLAGRAVVAATACSSIAALRGRMVGFDGALAGCASAQGFWVLGLAVRAGLMVALRRVDVETSAALFLPAGAYPALVWLALRQVDVFALAGWSAVAVGACRRGQTGWGGAVAVAVGLGLAEAGLRVGAGFVMGSAMRLALIPA